MKLYIVTADTYSGDYGTNIELLRVADNKDDALISVEFAQKKGWTPEITVVDINKPTRCCLGGYSE